MNSLKWAHTQRETRYIEMVRKNIYTREEKEGMCRDWKLISYASDSLLLICPFYIIINAVKKYSEITTMGASLSMHIAWPFIMNIYM